MTDEEYTPATDTVRYRYVHDKTNHWSSFGAAGEREDAEAEFDRWLNDQLAIAFERGQAKGMDVRNPYRKADS